MYRIDGASLIEIYKFHSANPYNLLWLKRRAILLDAEWDDHFLSHSVRAFKFDMNFANIIENTTVMNAVEGLDIESSIEIGENGIILFDYKKKELVEVKVI